MNVLWYRGGTKGLRYRGYTFGDGNYTGHDLVSGIHTILCVFWCISGKYQGSTD
jgi:hypothetical protein